MNELLTSIRRTPYQSLASFLILFFTLFLSLFFFNLTSFFNGILNFVESRPQVTVYFQKQTKEGDIFKVRDAVTASGKTSEVKYISKKQALKIYKDLNRDDPLLLEMVSAEILPASLEIYAQKPEYLQEIAEFLKKQPGVDNVVFQKDIVNKLLGVTDLLKKVSLFVLIFLILISFGVLMTTAAFKISLKKQEIELLRLLGASINYVRQPFLLEGVIFGVVSGTLAFIFYYLGFLLFSSSLQSYLVGVPRLPFYSLSSLDLYVWPPSIFFILFSYIATVLFGVLIGVIGNYLATSKYIK